jgi:hypothetical protein
MHVRKPDAVFDDPGEACNIGNLDERAREGPRVPIPQLVRQALIHAVPDKEEPGDPHPGHHPAVYRVLKFAAGAMDVLEE